MKGMDERIDKSTDSLAILKEWGMIGLLKGYMWDSVGSHLVSQWQKRLVDLVNDCLKKKGFVKGNAWGIV